MSVQVFPGGSDGKASASNEGDLGLIPGLGRSPGEGHGNPFQYSCLENPYGQRSLEGCNPRGHKGSDITEQLNTHTHFFRTHGLQKDFYDNLRYKRQAEKQMFQRL